MGEGAKKGKAGLVAEGIVETSRCVSTRSPHLQVISPSALKNRRLWGLDIKNALSRADGFARDAAAHAPPGMGTLQCTPSLDMD